MIWDDPWIACATDHSGPARRFCTTIPPPPPVLATGVRFDCRRFADIPIAAWIDLVGTRWTPADLAVRLANAWIPCVWLHETLVGTCVLRQHADMWLLETLRARSGHGTPLMRSVMTWIWRHVDGPFVLGFVWELNAAQLVAAWWRGWLAAAAAIEYGWVWRTEETCGFCPEQTQWTPVSSSRLQMPTAVIGKGWTAVVTDSGLGDGWGYVLAYKGVPDWSAIAAKGGWRSLWMRTSVAPSKMWRWTGEFVVVGLLNQWAPASQPERVWITAEIA